MTVLAIDTSTTRGSVAVLADSVPVFAEDFVADRNHSTTLFSALERAKALAPQFDQIAIGLGPGSYAGVRIAIAAAIGLELATGAELVGIPSVAAWETGADRFIAIGDARRQTFYWSEVDQGVCVEGPLLVTEEELRHRLGSTDLPVFASEAVPGFEGVQMALPTAAILARLASASRGIIARNQLEPIYLREPHITQPKTPPPQVFPG